MTDMQEQEPARPGFGIRRVEVLVGFCLVLILTLSVGGFIAYRTYEARHREEQDFAMAFAAANAKLGELRRHDFPTLLDDLMDGTIPLAFEVDGLTPVEPGVPAGTIGYFTCEDDDSPGARLCGLPTDLDMDGALGSTIRAYPYGRLPVMVLVRWRDAQGNVQQAGLYVLIADPAEGSAASHP